MGFSRSSRCSIVETDRERTTGLRRSAARQCESTAGSLHGAPLRGNLWSMSAPLTVTLPHQLGRAEARRRIEGGFAKIIHALPGSAGDFSERWDNRDNAYREFDSGIRHFAKRWREVCESTGNPNKDFAELFGEVVPTVIEKRARRLQESREKNELGIKSSGIIVPATAAAAVSRMRPNTNHGDSARN